ncbi:MAG: molybdopterin molybdotransferase MoeA [Dehalococcoidia bacterium]|jgi:molybdopterin molybdotransferase|nr:molybdopterin molybdotransferase MoeA [Chloroflexota bacterium]MCK4242892.1 molybdopterin molybdotransferase MoeA [Dehalococcoidia bacterium]
MITVEQALEKVLSCVEVLNREEKPILECLGQVLDEDVYSPLDVPPLDNAAMDGYAVQAESTRGVTQSSPAVLDVIGEVSAGAISQQEVRPGTAIRIMTGAPIPQGADSVVQFEDTDEALRPQRPISQIGILKEVKKGLNVRRAGEDISRGQLVLEKGTPLRPQEIGVLASIGKATAAVIRRPVVAILATGDELVEIDQPLPQGKIHNSNSFSLAAQVARYGGIPKILGIARDREEELEAKIRQALDSDLLLTSGGVSTGQYDLVKDVLAKQGEISFWTVRMKPGKPLAFGLINGDRKRVPHLGLPGNPVSSMVTFELFARPAILKMMGQRNLSKTMIRAISESRIENTDGRRVFARAVVRREGDHYYARTRGPQGSGILTSMTQANGLAIVPEDVAAVEEGEIIQVLMLDWREE